MTAKDDILREFREFTRFTGDGKPGAPSNAPLPVGDPQSGVYNPKKSALRLALGNLAQELMDGVVIVEGAIPAINTARDAAIADLHAEIDPLVAQAEAARDIAAGYASDTVSQGNVPIYSTAIGLASLVVAVGINAIRVNGYGAVDDGGGFYAVADPAGTVVDANGRKFRIASEILNPAMVGGDFALLESIRVGGAVDLLGRVWMVSAVPNGNDYYNGEFKVGSETFVQGRNPRNHPFENPAPTVKFVDPTARVYRGLNVAMFETSTPGIEVYLWREAPGHGNEDVGTRLLCARTDDKGNSFLLPAGTGNAGPEYTLVFTQADCDTRNFAAGAMGTRMGVMAARVKPDGSHFDPKFIYSDDQGLTWASLNVTGLTGSAWNFHSGVYPWVSGGADGFICYYYNAGKIGALTTANKGASWSQVADILSASGSFGSISEMSVAKVGASTWVMGIRTDGNENMAASISSDQTAWSPIVDSGLLLGSNPPELFVDSGKLFTLSFSRRDRSLVAGFNNALVIAAGNIADIIAFGGVSGWGTWEVVTSLPFFPTGYISIKKIRGRYYGLFNCEDYAGSTQSKTGYLMLVSSDPVPTAAYPAAAKARSNPNLCRNGAFRVAQLGETFTGTARTTVLDGFTFARTSSAAGWTVTRISGDKSRYAMRVRRDDADAATSAMNLTMTLTEADSLPLRGQQVTLSFRARKASGFSGASSLLTTQIRYSDQAEQVITAVSGLFSGGDTALGSSSTGMTLKEDWQTFRMTPGFVPATARQLAVRWTWTPAGTALNDYIDIELVKIEIGAQSTPFEFEDAGLELMKNQRFVRVMTVPTINGRRFLELSPQMHRDPAVTVSGGTLIAVSKDSLSLDDTGNNSRTVTAIATL